MRKTVIINLFGGPGSGKSTLAADLFSEMKKNKYEVEMVREWVKLWAWEGKKLEYHDQVVVFGNQVHEETALYGKVANVITDSPLILSGFYEKINYNTSYLLPAAKYVMDLAAQKNVIYRNILVKRNWPYETKGRFQTQDEAEYLDVMMIKFLKDNKLSYDTVSSVKEVMLELMQ